MNQSELEPAKNQKLTTDFLRNTGFDEIWERFERKSEKPLNTLPCN